MHSLKDSITAGESHLDLELLSPGYLPMTLLCQPLQSISVANASVHNGKQALPFRMLLVTTGTDFRRLSPDMTAWKLLPSGKKRALAYTYTLTLTVSTGPFRHPMAPIPPSETIKRQEVFIVAMHSTMHPLLELLSIPDCLLMAYRNGTRG